MSFWKPKEILQRLDAQIRQQHNEPSLLRIWRDTDLSVRLLPILKQANRAISRATAQVQIREWLTQESRHIQLQGPWFLLWRELFPLLQPAPLQPNRNPSEPPRFGRQGRTPLSPEQTPANLDLLSFATPTSQTKQGRSSGLLSTVSPSSHRPPAPSKGPISSGAISSGAISSGKTPSKGPISSGAISSGAISSGAISSGSLSQGSLQHVDAKGHTSSRENYRKVGDLDTHSSSAQGIASHKVVASVPNDGGNNRFSNKPSVAPPSRSSQSSTTGANKVSIRASQGSMPSQSFPSGSWDQWSATDSAASDLAEVIASKISVILHASPIAKWVDPGKFEKYLQKRMPQCIADGELDLNPIRRTLYKTNNHDAGQIERFIAQIAAQSWPLPLKILDLSSPAPASTTASATATNPPYNAPEGITVRPLARSLSQSSINTVSQRPPSAVSNASLQVTPKYPASPSNASLQVTPKRSPSPSNADLHTTPKNEPRTAAPKPTTSAPSPSRAGLSAVSSPSPSRAGLSAVPSTRPASRESTKPPPNESSLQSSLYASFSDIVPASGANKSLSVEQPSASVGYFPSGSWDQHDASPVPDQIEQLLQLLVNELALTRLSRFVDPHKFEIFLRKRIKKYIQNSQVDLEPIRETLMKTPKALPEDIDDYLRQVARTDSLFWVFRLPPGLRRASAVPPSHLKGNPQDDPELAALLDKSGLFDDLFPPLHSPPPPAKEERVNENRAPMVFRDASLSGSRGDLSQVPQRPPNSSGSRGDLSQVPQRPPNSSGSRGDLSQVPQRPPNSSGSRGDLSQYAGYPPQQAPISAQDPRRQAPQRPPMSSGSRGDLSQVPQRPPMSSGSRGDLSQVPQRPSISSGSRGDLSQVPQRPSMSSGSRGDLSQIPQRPPASLGYPPEPLQGYPSQSQGYPSQSQGYPSQSQGYPSQSQGYPPQPHMSYPPQPHMSYPPQSAYPPEPQISYPPQPLRAPMTGSMEPYPGSPEPYAPSLRYTAQPASPSGNFSAIPFGGPLPSQHRSGVHPAPPMGGLPPSHRSGVHPAPPMGSASPHVAPPPAAYAPHPTATGAYPPRNPPLGTPHPSTPAPRVSHTGSFAPLSQPPAPHRTGAFQSPSGHYTGSFRPLSSATPQASASPSASTDFYSPVVQTDSLGVKRSTMQVQAIQSPVSAGPFDDVLSAWDDPNQTTARHPGFFKPNLDWMGDEPAAPPSSSAARFPGGDPLFANGNFAAKSSETLAPPVAVSPLPVGTQPSISAFASSHPPIAQPRNTGANLRPAHSDLSVGDLISISASLPAISFNPMTGVRPALMQDDDDHTVNEPREVTMRVSRPLPPAPKARRGLWFLRILLLLFLGIAMGLFAWMRLQHDTPIQGKPLSKSLYQAYLPVDFLYQDEQTLNLVLPAGWYKGPLGRNLEERVFSLRDKLKLQRIRYLQIFSPRKQLLYRVDLDKQI